MKITDLHPDLALCSLLGGGIIIAVSPTDSREVPAYTQSARPNRGVPDEFVEVLPNGFVSSRTIPKGCFTGNLAVAAYCKSNPDNTANRIRLEAILGICEELVDGKSADGYFFELDSNNLITPPTVNQTTGYAMAAINVTWRTNF